MSTPTADPDTAVVRALSLAGVSNPSGLVRRYGRHRCTDVGRAYRMAQEDGTAKSPGWIIQALRQEWDVTEHLTRWRERREARRARLYLVKQGELAQSIEFKQAQRKAFSREEKYKPLADFLGLPEGAAALEQWKTCLVCEDDPCRCPPEDVLQRAREKARRLKPLIEEKAAEERRRTYLEKNNLFALENLPDILKA